ncbi:MAG: MFS transporter [Chloroflexi bacterium]|nr:MFS transporter [Chloroflexota bacterium]
MTNGEQPAADKPLSYWRRRVFAVAWLTYAGYYLGRVNFAVALPSLRADLGWSKAVAGLIGSLFYWVYATGQLVNGQLGDRVSARRMVGLGLAASGLINIALAFPLVRSSALSSQLVLAVMLVLWLANGWMQSTGWGPIVKTLSLWFSPAERGRVTALFNPCYVVGHAAAWALVGALIARHGWRAAFGGPGVLLLFIAALWYLLLPERAPEDHEQPLKPALSPASVLRGLREVAALPQMRWALAICFLSGMVKDGLTLWGPTYLVEAQGLSLSTAALTATLIPIAGICGAIAGGAFLHGRDHGSEMRIVIGFALTLALGAVALYHFGDDHRVALAVAALALIATSSHGINALLMSALPLSLGPRGKVSAAAGTLDFVSYLGGGLSATLIGGIEETWGWGAVYGIWVGIALAIGALAWISRRKRALTNAARSN